jgi:hypothetical protein
LIKSLPLLIDFCLLHYGNYFKTGIQEEMSGENIPLCLQKIQNERQGHEGKMDNSRAL